LKYSFIKGVASFLGELLYLHTSYPDVDAVTFVPLTKEKQRMRGFNQAEEIARAFGQLTQLPVLPLLIRTQSSHSSQASLRSKHERLLNAKHQVFKYNHVTRAPTTVILIDDVYTTGATLEACAAVLRQHGVKDVHGLVVAHGS
jgi:predicted amidophosphoribosyltransferase